MEVEQDVPQEFAVLGVLVRWEVGLVEMLAFLSEWFNFSFLGNETRHLHCHFVRRHQLNFRGLVGEHCRSRSGARSESSPVYQALFGSTAKDAAYGGVSIKAAPLLVLASDSGP